MRKTLPVNVYTQINTDDTAYLFQNLDSHDVKIIVSDTEPVPTSGHDFIVGYRQGISGSDIVGILWGKPTNKIDISVGIVEE